MLPLCRLYYVAMSIGNPPKPYFLDVDTGSDLTWLQCDAPCVSCSKVPFPCLFVFSLCIEYNGLRGKL